jgi:hypothetical protein
MIFSNKIVSGDVVTPHHLVKRVQVITMRNEQEVGNVLSWSYIISLLVCIGLSMNEDERFSKIMCFGGASHSPRPCNNLFYVFPKKKKRLKNILK